MWYDLNGLAKVIATSFLVYHGLIDTTSSNAVMTCGLNICKAFVMTKVEIGLHTIGRNIALAMLIRV